MKNAKAKKIATYIIVPLMVAFFLLDILTVVLGNNYAKKYMPTQENFNYENGNDRIHFLNTANSDCILIESNGHFALIDSGEGSFNPRRKTDYKGYENIVLDYLKKVAIDKDGKVKLDFILATHYHYDHIGSFHSIITDKDIIIEKAYFKPYNAKLEREYESDRWGLKDCYNQIIDDIQAKNIDLIQTIPESINFGDFQLFLYNRGYYEDLYGKGANAESIGIKVIKGKKSAFLAADITKSSGLEEKLGEEIGNCNLLKIGHHGYFGSSSTSFLDCINPEICIVTNQQGKVYPNVKWNLTMHAKSPFYGTYDYNGIIASFTDDDNIILTYNIH